MNQNMVPTAKTRQSPINFLDPNLSFETLRGAIMRFRLQKVIWSHVWVYPAHRVFQNLESYLLTLFEVRTVSYDLWPKREAPGNFFFIIFF